MATFFIPSRCSVNLPFHSYTYFTTLFYALLFFFNPTISIVVSFLDLVFCNKPSKRKYYTFYLLLAAWLGVLNMTKQLFSDQIYYAKIFVSVDRTNFFSAVFNYRGTGALSLKEFFFNFYSVVLNYFTNANSQAYFFILTVNIYFLHFLSIHKVYSACNRVKFEILCSVILMAFFFPFFIQSVHAVRQILATSFLVYAIAYKSVNGRTHWPFLLIAFFIHNTTIFFIVCSLLPGLYKIHSFKQILLYLSLFVLFILSYVQLGTILSTLNLGAISAVGERMMTAELSDENELFSIRNTLIYSIPVMLCSVLIIKRDYMTQHLSSLGTFAYLSMLTLLFVFSMTNAPTLQFRYMFYIYSFFPFIVLPIADSANISSNIYTLLVTLFFAFRFFLVDVDWDLFASSSDFILNTFIDFLITSYYSI